MNYIVFDLEWNQGQHRPEHSHMPSFEIIEIGAVKLNDKFQVVDFYQSLVRPQLYNTMHKYTAEIVNLDMEDLQKERPFKEVVREFLTWCGEEYQFCIWGVQDLTELQKNMDYYNMEALSIGPMMYYDVQKLYSLSKQDGKQRMSLSNVVELENLLEDEVPFHRALGDAYYTALIFQKIAGRKLLEHVSFDTYRVPTSNKEQILWKFDGYTKFISQGYGEKAELMANKNIACIRCILCEKALRKKIPWYTLNSGKHYYTVAKCPEHGYMKGKIRIRKSKDDDYYAVKTVKHVDEKEALEIIERKLIQKK